MPCLCAGTASHSSRWGRLGSAQAQDTRHVVTHTSASSAADTPLAHACAATLSSSQCLSPADSTADTPCSVASSRTWRRRAVTTTCTQQLRTSADTSARLRVAALATMWLPHWTTLALCEWVYIATITTPRGPPHLPPVRAISSTTDVLSSPWHAIMYSAGSAASTTATTSSHRSSAWSSSCVAPRPPRWHRGDKLAHGGKQRHDGRRRRRRQHQAQHRARSLRDVIPPPIRRLTVGGGHHHQHPERRHEHSRRGFATQRQQDVGDDAASEQHGDRRRVHTRRLQRPPHVQTLVL
jgi:hypothetical protein